MAHPDNSVINSGGTGVVNNCLVCLGSAEHLSKKPSKLPSLFGRSNFDAFVKICELLQVTFSEIQHDWSFGGREGEGKTGEEDKLPFCSLCLTGFHSVLKLEQQLVSIQKKIQDKIDAIRDRIRQSNNTITTTTTVEDLKAVTFRSKALIYHDSSRKCLPTENAPTTSNHSYSTGTSQQSAVAPTSWSHSHQAPATSSSSITTPLQSQQYSWTPPSQACSGATETKIEAVSTAASEDYNQNYYEDGNDNDDGNYSACDSENAEDDTDYYGAKSSRKTATKSEGATPKTKAVRNKPAWATSRSSSTSKSPRTKRVVTGAGSRERQRQAEYFSPVITGPDGKMIFEGITITPLEKGYMCGQCGATVGKDHSSIALRKTKIHIKGFHLGAYKCTICDRNFTSNDILNQHHMHIHEKGEVPCTICGKPIQERNMKGHQFTHMNATEKEAAIASGFKPQYQGELTLPCRICGKLFDKPSRLRRHEIVHVSAVFRRDYKCEFCDKAYTTEQARKDHYAQAHETLNARKRLCKICGESVFAKTFTTHMRTHDKAVNANAYQCKVCEKGFFDPKRHRIHEDKCGSQKGVKKEGCDFECDICHKSFAKKKTMLSHRRKVHKSHWKLKVPAKLAEDVSIENPSQDPLDDLNNEGIQHVKGNVYSYQLYDLEKITGSGGVGYRCRTCSEEVYAEEGEDLEEQVKEHVKSKHMGSFRCNKCTKRMKTLFEVETHLRSEHAKLSGYDCDICGRTAIPPKTIKKHIWLHRSFWEMAEAVNAGELFPDNYRKWEVQDVLKKMGVELNLKCVICEKSDFDVLEDLYNHRKAEHPDAPVIKLKRKKTGRPKVYRNVPVDCSECGNTYDNAEKLRRHRYKVHSRKRKRAAAAGGSNKSKTRSKTIKVETKRRDTSEEDEEDQEDEWREGSYQYLEENVEIKEEVVTPSNSEDEEMEDEYVRYSSGDEVEVKYRPTQTNQDNDGATTEEGNGTGERRRSLRDRSSLRRSSYRNINYVEDEDGDDDDDNSDET